MVINNSLEVQYRTHQYMNKLNNDFNKMINKYLKLLFNNKLKNITFLTN